MPAESCLQGTLYQKCGVLFPSQWIHLHSFQCLSLLRAHSNYQQLRSPTTVHILSPSVTGGRKKGLLLVHSCCFDTTLSLACKDALHIGLFAVKPGYFLPFYCQKKNSGRICVQTQLLHTVFLLWLVWDGGRCGMFLYKRNNGREDPEACKRWICAVITVMARRLFTSSVSNVLSRPLSGLVMQISAQSNNSPWRARARPGALSYSCMLVSTHLHRSLAGGNDWVPYSSDKVRKDLDMVVFSGKTSWAQLAAIPQGYLQAKVLQPTQKSFMVKNKERKFGSFSS